MKLIAGKINDYYDSLLKYNSTEGNTFHRTNETVSVSYDRSWRWGVGYKNSINAELAHPLTYLLEEKYISFVDDYSHRTNHGGSLVLNFISVLFCGKLYFGLRFKVTPKGEMRSVDTIVYSYEDLVKFCQANEIELKKTTKEEKRSVWKKPFFRADRLENFFTPVDCLDFSIENKLVIAVIDSNLRPDYGKQEIQLNCELKKYEFYKVFDAYSAYQELSMYVDDQLTYPGNIMIEVEDKYKITGKGFDPVYGFRTRPTDNKQKGK